LSNYRFITGAFYMIGYGELIVILCVILILFGGKKLPEFAKSLGKGIREFKKALNGDLSEDQEVEKTVALKEDENEHRK